MIPSLALLLSLFGGCYKNTIETGKSTGEAHTETVVFLLWGLVGDATFEVDKICPSGVARIEEEMAPVDAVLNCLTCGVYSPRTVTITCAGGRAFLVTPSVDSGIASVLPLEGSP